MLSQQLRRLAGQVLGTCRPLKWNQLSLCPSSDAATSLRAALDHTSSQLEVWPILFWSPDPLKSISRPSLSRLLHSAALTYLWYRPPNLRCALKCHQRQALALVESDWAQRISVPQAGKPPRTSRVSRSRSEPSNCVARAFWTVWSLYQLKKIGALGLKVVRKRWVRSWRRIKLDWSLKSATWWIVLVWNSCDQATGSTH